MCIFHSHLIVQYVRHEPNIAPDLDPRDLWQCSTRNRGVYCINPHHCNYEPNRKTNPMTDNLIRYWRNLHRVFNYSYITSPPTLPNQNPQCVEAPNFSTDQWCHLSFIRFYKVINSDPNQRIRRLHDEMQGFCETDKIPISLPKGINDHLVSSIKVGEVLMSSLSPVFLFRFAPIASASPQTARANLTENGRLSTKSSKISLLVQSLFVLETIIISIASLKAVFNH